MSWCGGGASLGAKFGAEVQIQCVPIGNGLGGIPEEAESRRWKQHHITFSSSSSAALHQLHQQSTRIGGRARGGQSSYRRHKELVTHDVLSPVSIIQILLTGSSTVLSPTSAAADSRLTGRYEATAALSSFISPTRSVSFPGKRNTCSLLNKPASSLTTTDSPTRSRQCQTQHSAFTPPEQPSQTRCRFHPPSRLRHQAL